MEEILYDTAQKTEPIYKKIEALFENNAPSTDVNQRITMYCEDICDLLISKNKAYGNSALDPVHIFSDVGTLERLNIRIDDKLSRIMRGHEYSNEDTEKDLIGYLILKQIYKRIIDENKIKKETP